MRSPEGKPFTRADDVAGGPCWRYRTWSAEEWEAIPPELRPRAAFPFGFGWAEMNLYAGRGDAHPEGTAGSSTPAADGDAGEGDGHD